MSIEQDIAKARRRPMDAAKMKDLLTKLRKGASASLTFGKLVQVLDHLGWKIEPVLGWTPRHYQYKEGEHLVSADTVRMPLESLQQLHAKMVEAQVDELPAAPGKVGEVVVMDVGEIKEGSALYGTPIRYFYRREWVGTEGVTVTSPRGQELTFLPDHHDLDRGHKNLADDPFASSDVWKGVKDAGVVDDVNAALGTEAHVPAAARTRENTGTCPACWGNYKLSGGKLVLHGYERPGYGYIKGQCFCVGMSPLETSKEGAAAFREFLQGILAQEEGVLGKLESGQVDAVEGRRGKVYKRGVDQEFERVLEDAVRRTKESIEQVKGDLELYDKVLRAWHPRELPREGELQRGPGFFTK